MPGDTKEKGLEELIEASLLTHGWLKRTAADYGKEYAIDEEMLKAFLNATQKDVVARSKIFSDELEHKRFLTRLQNEITTRGVIDVLRHGLAHKSYNFMLYYPTPTMGNEKAKTQFAQNRWTVARQVHYSFANDNSIDMVLMLNGLPIITMELKNNFTGQNFGNAISQYQNDRSPQELLFRPKRCAVHFAVDDNEVYMCTALSGANSWFLPFNKGYNDGAGNPPCESGPRTSYLWEEILQIDRLSNIIENYAQVIRKRNEDTGKIEEKVIWPRCHQLEAVRALLAATAENPACGQRYLIQHSAGSGKSNSITWLAYQLAGMKEADGITPRFASVLVITDRRNLDTQIRDNIRAFCNNKSIVQWAEDSEALKTALQGGKTIIVSTVCKFPFILQTIGHELKNKKFCVIIDEAHSSQAGGMASALNSVIGGFGMKGKKPEDTEDELNELLAYVIAGRTMAANSNFYAFTATPKNKTLELFGIPYLGEDGEEKHRPFHYYSMKQAIEEKFILDVLEHYTPYGSFYRILKASEANPEFEKAPAERKLRAWVESRPETVEAKSKVIVEHFLNNVAHRIKGQARAMVVTPGIERAIDYFFAIRKLLEERHSPYKAVVAFSGTKDYHGRTVDEAQLNGFPSSRIEKIFRSGNYRILIVADKFQTGYDEPLLHTMYVDKPLADIKAVQTLSRLNRSAPNKKDTFVLDFANSEEVIKQAFQKYYTSTILSGVTDINKLNDLLRICDESMVYEEDEVTDFNLRYWRGDERKTLDPLIDKCVERFKALPNLEEQIKVKSAMRLFCRTYEFLAAIMEDSRIDWEKKNTFLHFLRMKLPKLAGDEDPTAGLLELVDFEKYRVFKKEERSIQLENKTATIQPLPISDPQGGHNPDPEMETLDKIVEAFNAVFGNIEGVDPEILEVQARTVGKAMLENDYVRDALLNNDEVTQAQVVHDKTKSAILDVTRKSTELQNFYLRHPEKQAQLENAMLMLLQDNINPPYNETLLREKIVEAMNQDFKDICPINQTTLDEVTEALFKVLNAETLPSLDGLKQLKRTLNLCYRTSGRNEDYQDWLQTLIMKFEAFLKKVYYLREGSEIAELNGKKVQFLGAAKATWVNQLHFSEDEVLHNFKVYYEFLHDQRNEQSHMAPEIKDSEVKAGIHMTVAMYLYATMINLKRMKSCGLAK